MASFITPPADELNVIFRGDIDILNAYSANNGSGTLHIREGGLYVQGLTDLDQTTINTLDGKFHVLGPNKVEIDISGGATSSIEFTAEDNSFFTTTAGTVTLSATATDANGKVNILAAGTGPNSILIDAQNATDGQIVIQSAGADTASDAVKILASDTVGGNVLVQAKGDFETGTPAIKLLADNATSGQILLESAGDSATSNAVSILATGTTGGNVNIVASGSTVPAILADATSNLGKILVRSAGDSSTENAIELLATATSEGNILVQANGLSSTNPSIKLLSDNETSGQILLEANGNIANAIRVTATSTSGPSGIDVDATGLISIDTTSIASGIAIATATEGVPVVIGTLTSLTTIAGDLLVQGTTTTINTETLTVEDNIILLNSGNGELGIDSGLIVRRFQTANNGSIGDVVAGPTPVQETGLFQAGSSAPGTLVLDTHASDSDDFYNGWWVKITSGTGVDQVRRIKDYVGSTKTATLYVAADNTDSFYDGLDLTTAPVATDSYNLYSDAFQMTFYDESRDQWTFANVSKIPDPVSGVGISTADIQQYQQVSMGALEVHPQIYKNANGSASGTTVTFTLLNHEIIAGQRVGISDSVDFTPSIPAGPYTVTSTPDANTFTIEVPVSTVSVDASSATLKLYHTSTVFTNIIRPIDPEFGDIAIPSLTCFEDITIPKTSTAYFFVNLCSMPYGAVMIYIADLYNTDGSFGVFAAARSTSVGSGAVSRLASASGEDGQRIDVDWLSGEKIKIRHRPAGSGLGNYTYRVRLYYCLPPDYPY